jgi:hypothetical protein
MSNLKETVPDIETLKQRISEQTKLTIEEFLFSTKHEREAITNNRRYFFVTLLLLIASFLVASTLPFYVAALIIISLAAATGSYGYLWDKNLRALAKKHNEALVPIISKCLGSLVAYTHDGTKGEEVTKLLKASELLMEDFNYVSVDDVYKFENKGVAVHELEVTRQVRTGKNSSNVNIFKGLFIKADLRKPLLGHTFISTEGDKLGSSHKDFMTGLFRTSKVKETQLEWNEFERDLHVATDNEVEARYVLTPSFMVHLHDWWVLSRENIRIVFKDKEMYMLLPNAKIKFNTSTTSVKPEELNKYAESVIEPLWRTLTLVEDISI